MFKVTLSLQEKLTGDQLKDQIKQTIKAAREAQEEAIRDVQTERGVMVVPPVPPIGPQGTPIVGVQEGWNGVGIPPGAKDISIAFFVMVAAVISVGRSCAQSGGESSVELRRRFPSRLKCEISSSRLRSQSTP